ncbi:hypothetical protein [Pseudomonas fluorescens]|uniref:hypothetical protein n=1 Tax=Pseudomonas fluorescens TaxID=294 RepID=UPI002113B62F|nr:hypothetical protein [Pseudomonas fluorescens]
MPLAVFAFTYQGSGLVVETFNNQLRLIVALKENLQVFADALKRDVFRGYTVFTLGKDVFTIRNSFDFSDFALGQNLRLDNRIFIDNGRIYWNYTHHNYLNTSSTLHVRRSGDAVETSVRKRHTSA